MGPEDELLVMECCNPDAAALLAGLGERVRHVSGPHAGKCTKLNQAAGIARGEVVLITDDDCRVPEDWADSLAAAFENPLVGVVFGPSEGLSSEPGSAPPPVVPPGPAPSELWNYAHGLSMAVRRIALADVGGFDERFGPGAGGTGEEADVVLRLAERGWLCAIARGHSVHHLDWRNTVESARNVSAYQRGTGAYLGAGLRRAPRRTTKTLVLRLAHERGYWLEGGWKNLRLRTQMAVTFARGLAEGLGTAPRRFLPPPGRTGRPTDRIRVLWVTSEAPDRHQGGGNIRQAMLLEQLEDRADVTLLLVGDLEDEDVRRDVAVVAEVPRPRVRRTEGPIGRRVRDLWRVLVSRRPSEVEDNRRIRRTLQPLVNRLAADHEVVVVHHLGLAGVLRTEIGTRWILHLFDVASRRARHELETEVGRRQRWLLEREGRNAARYERQMIDTYDGLVVVSDLDAAAMGATDAHLVPNGVDLRAFTMTPVPSDQTLLLPATLDYRPNVLGACWFCDEVLPLVQQQVPDVRFALVGRNPVAEVIELAERPGVELHADVPTMAPWLAWARVVVVPLWIGTGTRLKALEAMAAGRPLVGTTIGLEGLDLVDGVHARLADDPATMATAIVELLTSDASARALGEAGRAHVTAHFSWDAIGERLDQALTERAATARS